MITIIERTIEKVQFKLEVDPQKPNRTIAGSPILWINNEPHIIYAVDTLTVIKAIATAKNMIYVKQAVEGTWCEETITKTITQLEKEYGYI